MIRRYERLGRGETAERRYPAGEQAEDVDGCEFSSEWRRT